MPDYSVPFKDPEAIGPATRTSVPAAFLSEPNLREFYDPAGLHRNESTEVFLDRVATTRRLVTLRGLGELSGHEAILAEATHALLGFEQHQDSGLRLPIAPERQQAIVNHLHTYAGMVALSVREVADGIIEQYEHEKRNNPDLYWQKLPSRFVLTGKVLAAIAHAGVVRRSGRDYFTHPDEVSSIISTAWAKSSLYQNTHTRDILRFIAYTHDAPEDNIDAHGAYLGETLIVSPLIVQKTLEQQRVPEAASIARTLYMMMRTRDTKNNRMGYLDYINRGAQQTDPVGMYFVLGKSADISHNRTVEPDQITVYGEKAREKYNKRRTYEDAAVFLLKIAERYNAPLGLLPHMIFAVSTKEIRDAADEKYPIDISNIAESVREKVQQRLHG